METMCPVKGSDGSLFWVSESIYRTMVSTEAQDSNPVPNDRPKKKPPVKRGTRTRRAGGSVTR